jgi:predicted fused transcriptional regulator/phosphomethylpyrimidine kinase
MAEEIILVSTYNTILLKKALAKNLNDKKIDQVQISNILGMSQPMISNYLNSNERFPKNIIDLAEKISKKIYNGNSAHFHTCISFLDKEIEGQFYVANKNELINEDKNKIINNLTGAFLLLKDKNINGLIPEIKINIAMIKDKAKNSDDVAAFLNGLIIVDNKATGNNGIRFGKSKHLSSLLLYLKKEINVNAIMNVAYNKNIDKTSFKIGFLTKNFKLEKNQKNLDVLLHKGDFGIEPCTYILGKDAIDVVKKILKLKEELNDFKR